MKKKIQFVFFLIFGSQCMIACCDEETFEVRITGMESRALILDGINAVEVNSQNPIDKEDLILEASFIEVQELVTTGPSKQNKKEVEVMEAAVVPCSDPTFIYKNNIVSVKVEVLDVDNGNARTDITNQMVIQGTQLSIADYIAQSNPGIRNLLVQVADVTNIPNRIEYTIEATLDDGLILSSGGGIINFN